MLNERGTLEMRHGFTSGENQHQVSHGIRNECVEEVTWSIQTQRELGHFRTPCGLYNYEGRAECWSGSGTEERTLFRVRGLFCWIHKTHEELGLK